MIIGIVLAYLFQWVIDKGLQKSGYSPDYKEWYEIMHSQVNADIIIQGSSTARIQFSPKLLEDQFNLSTYNFGISGATFPFEDYKFKMYMLHNKKPKYIIQVVDANTLTNAIDVDFVQFIPYLSEDLVSSFKNHILFTNKDVYIPLYKYSHRVGAVAAGLNHLFDRNVQGNGNYKGFQTFDKHYDKQIIDEILKKSPNGFYAPYSTMVYKKFINFVDYCKKEKIRLIIVYPPAQADFTNHLLNRDSVSGWYNKIAKNYGVVFFDYSNLPLARDTSMYFDYFHLNSKGVKCLNEVFIKDLKSIVK